MIVERHFDWSMFDQPIIIDNQAFITETINSYVDWISDDF